MEIYNEVNRSFARALVPLLRPDDLVWVHDYHLIPLGQALRELNIAAKLGFFLHVPFPPAQTFLTLPRADALAGALQAYDLVGVQTQDDADNLDALLAHFNARKRSLAFPISIDSSSYATSAARSVESTECKQLVESLNDRALILGVDRLDYSKGIPNRFRGFARLLERFPEHRHQVTFLQIAPVSRGDVPQYRALRRELEELTGRINGERAEIDWVPIRYMTRSVSRSTLAGFYRAARVGCVTPLRDGMNLVAKEYVAAQNPEDPGALVLSRFSGAARELEASILVNPYDPDEIAEALDVALKMPLDERQCRWREMWNTLQRNTAATWAKRFIDTLEACSTHGRS